MKGGMNNPTDAKYWDTILPKKECEHCYGFGLWAIGGASPMGPTDAEDGYPTLKCKSCGSDANPLDKFLMRD